MNKKFVNSILLVSLTLSTFSCASATRTENAANNNANATIVSADENSDEATALNAVGAGAEQQTATPDALVKDLYKTHDADLKAGGAGRILNGKDRKMLDKYFDKTLADFIWKDLTTHKDEVGVLDFDPFYNAQDVGIKNLVVGAPKLAGDKATVPVTFQNYDRKDKLEYSLTRQNSSWKISDIKYTDGSTLLGYFKEDAKNKISSNSSDGDNFFEGTYKVGTTTCTVKPIKMAFELRWAKGSGVMIFVFDGDATTGNYSYSSEDGGNGKDTFIFDDDTFTTGKFIRADGKEMPVSKIG